MSDVRDMLGISSAASTVAASSASLVSPRPNRSALNTATPGNSSAAPHPSGSPTSTTQLPRELAQLRAGINESFVPMAPTVPAAAFKAKRVKAVSWKCLPIRSSARTAHTGKPIDDLDLMHWVKIHNVPDYRFARFNKPIKFLDYTDEEYQEYCHDPAWSRQETDRLMQLAKQFDLRFILMEDRYNEASESALKRWTDSQLPSVDEKHIQHIVVDVLKREKDLHHPSTNNNTTTTDATTTATTTVSSKPVEESKMSDDATASASATTAALSTTTTTTTAPSSTPFSSSAASSSAAASAFAAGAYPYRSVESLKARFYFLQQTLTTLRNASDPDLRKD